MFKTRRKMILILFAIFLFIIIMDSNTAVNAAKESIDMCIKTVVPSVFPFLVLGGAMAAEIAGTNIPILEQLLHIPKGAAGYFLIGQLCGYPVGAKLLQDAMDRNEIDSSSAARMVSFCNNASPAFIIGIMTPLFSDIRIAIILWFIQITSSLVLGMILPQTKEAKIRIKMQQTQSITATMAGSIKGTATICGWIVLLSILLAYINQPIISKVSPLGEAFLSGAIELTNGLFRLHKIQFESIRFAIGSVLLSLGGLCVLLQTKSTAPNINIRAYLFARFMHAIISSTLATIIGHFIFTNNRTQLSCLALLICGGIICYCILIFNKKMVAIADKV